MTCGGQSDLKPPPRCNGQTQNDVSGRFSTGYASDLAIIIAFLIAKPYSICTYQLDAAAADVDVDVGGRIER